MSAEYDKFIESLKKLNIKVVIFDLDLTAARMHSFGVLVREELNKFLESSSPDFKMIVPALLSSGFEVAIATFNDDEIVKYIPMYGAKLLPNWRPSKQNGGKINVIAGYELVEKFLLHNFDEETVRKIHVVAFNPSLHSQEIEGDKNYHLDIIARHYGVDKKQCVLFDDKEENVFGFGGKAFHVYGENGFKLEHLKLN